MLPRQWWGFTWYFARDNLLKQYQRTKFGPLWIVMTQFVMIFGVAIVFYSIFRQPLAQFLAFISAGLLTWNFIANPVSQAPTVFVNSASIIQSFKISFAVLPVQTMANHLMIYLHGLIIHVLVLMIVGKTLWLLPLAVPGIILVLFIIYPLVAVLGILGARFRDLGPAMSSAMYVAFLVTPVIWDKQHIADHMSWVADLNPFFHMLEIIRRPLLGEWPPVNSTVVCVVLAMASLSLGEWLFRRYSRPLVFWV